ncbi:acyl-CoA dehydrogenase family protein [Amycolatopsis jejuensis]|uniref:acyl-CoA dehydrogenase family protein n=1 Tax=Amycolatopsis jejuensis TaxID=330084 RepID=UPI000524209B|nr:acyl-CoA dehydrogenase family protein [Amycolatopsis jejuensis]
MSDEIDELRRTVRRFLDERSDEREVRRLMADPVGYDPAVWRQMTEQLGLAGLAIAEEHGGSGAGFDVLAVVFEEHGRLLTPSPLFASVALAATALQQSGDKAAMAEYLPGIAGGESIATLAFSESDAGRDTRARSGKLTGRKRYVADAHVADLILVTAQDDEGLSLFAVEREAPGLTVTAELTMDQTRKLATVDLADTPARLIGTPGAAPLHRTLLTAGVALAAEQTGGAQRVLDMAVDYAKTRVQFGRPIGSFQAVKHKLADMLVDVETCRAAAEAAAVAIATDAADLELAASVAKAYCSDAYYRTAAEALQIFGGIGFTWEHSVQLYFKRAKSSQLLLGSPGYHRDLVGQALGI